MKDERKQEHLADVDRVLAEVREQLAYDEDQGDVYELRALQLLLEVTKVLHSQHDTHSLITLVLDSALSFAEADRAFLMLFDPAGELRFKMGRTYNGTYLTREEFIISNTVVQEAISSTQPVIVADAQSDDRFKSRQSVVGLSLRTVMAASLRMNDRVIGVLYVDSQRPMARYSRHHLSVLSSLAQQSAVALSNAQKFETFTG